MFGTAGGADHGKLRLRWNRPLVSTNESWLDAVARWKDVIGRARTIIIAAGDERS